jgi:hypothetical protein
VRYQIDGCRDGHPDVLFLNNMSDKQGRFNDVDLTNTFEYLPLICRRDKGFGGFL